MKQPFFIIGMGRSGSTYFYHLLKEHPDIAMTNEGRVLDALAIAFEILTLPAGERSESRGFTGVVNKDTISVMVPIFVDHAQKMIEEFYENYFDRPFTHWGDKLPDAGAAVATTMILPQTRYLLLVRDPRDVVCSYRSYAPHSGPRADEVLSQTLDDLAEAWRKQYRFILDRLSEYRLVEYEKLVRRPRETLAASLEYLGLAMDPAVERAIEKNDSFSGHATSRSPEASLGRWRHDLTEAEARMVAERCGPMMKELGLTLEP